MKKHTTIFLVIAALGILTIAISESCRKIDREPANISINEVTSRFFNQNTSVDPLVKAIAGCLQRSNEKSQFVKATVDRAGYPRWNRAVTISGKPKVKSGRLSNEDSAQITYVPFVKDSQNYVNAALLVKTTSTDTAVQWLMDWQYASYGFDSTSTKWSARNVFHIFAALDNEVFGRTEFEITDDSLFGEPPAGKISVVKVKQGGQSNRSSLWTTVTMCNYVDVCFGPAWYESWCNGGCTEDCEFYTHTEAICTTLWVDDGWVPVSGGGGTGGGGGGGSGGGDSGSSTPPPCPGSGSGRTYNPCGPGWIPVVLNDDPTPPDDSTIAANLKKIYMKVKAKADSIHSAAQLNGNERAFSYRFMSNDTIAYNIVEGDYQSSDPMTGANIFGLDHTHQDNGLPASNPASDVNQTFDTDDVFKFYSDHVLSAGSKELKIQTITTRDYVYAAYITDINLFKANVVAQAGTSVFFSIADILYKKYDSLMKTCTTPPACTYERQSELALLAIFGSNSGVKFFKSPRNNINFIKL